MRRTIPVKLYEEGLGLYEIRRFRCKVNNNIPSVHGNIRFTPEGKERFKGDEVLSNIASYDFHMRLCDKDGGILEIADLKTPGLNDNTDSVDLSDTGRLCSSEDLEELSFVEIVVHISDEEDFDCDWVHRRHHHGF